MLLTDAAEWAAFDRQVPGHETLAQDDARRGLTDAIARAFWTYVWPGIKDDRLKVRLWFLRPSVKVAALQPFFEMIFGEAPADA